MNYLLNYYQNASMWEALRLIIRGRYNSEITKVKEEVRTNINQTNKKIAVANKKVEENISITHDLAKVTGVIK